jgi:hypothetical protein
MSSVTEIYVCKLRQELKKGKLFTSGDIHTRAEAETDARERCGFDDSIAKIGYYTTQEDGSFKSILIYENPDVDLSRVQSEDSGSRTELMAAAQQAHADVTGAPKPRRSMMSKFMNFFTEEAS